MYAYDLDHLFVYYEKYKIDVFKKFKVIYYLIWCYILVFIM